MFRRLASLIISMLFITILFNSCESKDDSSAEEIQSFRELNKIKSVNHFYFVGKTRNRTGVYKYDLSKNDYEMIWNDINESVLLLAYSGDMQHAFFITANKIGIDRGVSFIRRVKLYSLGLNNSSVRLISEIGNAVQLFAEWIEMNFEVQFTQFDLKVASHINKINQIYSPFGKLIYEDKEIFDFITEGYPQFNIHRNSLISPSGNFGLMQSADSIYFLGAGNEQRVFIDSTAGIINDISWSDDESFIFFTTNSTDSSGKEQSSFYIYDIIKKMLLKKEQSDEKIYFIIINNLVAFDDYSESQPRITLFNFRDNKAVSEISVPGGCSLKYLKII